jgi:Uma2 family endonuclease
MKRTMSRLPEIPKLVAHDHLTRAEFERRYEAMPDNVKAELLNGAVFVAQPSRHVYRGRPQSMLQAWLIYYAEMTPGVDLGDNCTLRLSEESEPQPDLLLRIPAERGGSSALDADGYLIGAPELVVEVAASSASYDLHDKLDVYRRFGVQEYVVHRTEDGEVDWFVRRGDRYERLAPDEDGCFHSEMFPGLWLDPQALLANDLPALRAIVQRGVQDPAHAPFVERLRGVRGPGPQ